MLGFNLLDVEYYLRTKIDETSRGSPRRKLIAVGLRIPNGLNW